MRLLLRHTRFGSLTELASFPDVALPERAEDLLVDGDHLARLLGEPRRERERLVLELGRRKYLVEESPLAQGLGIQRLAREHQAPGVRLSDDGIEALESRYRVVEPVLHRGHRELERLVAEAEVGRCGELHAATIAIGVEHRDR